MGVKYNKLLTMLKHDLKKSFNENIRKIIKEEIKFAFELLTEVKTKPIISAPQFQKIINEQKNNAHIANVDSSITLTGHSQIATSPEAIKKAVKIQTKDYRELLKKAK